MSSGKTSSGEKNVTEEARTLGALLRSPYQKLQRHTYGRLAASGFDDIRPAHSSVFRHILPSGSRATELAEAAQMTKQSMAYLINYLEQRGYVELVPDPVDGRAKLVRLTRRGEKFQRAAMKLSLRLEEDLARQLGQDEVAQLRRLLERAASEIDALQE
jgi:DNA-binding MarR family transcriptional regulator